MKKFEIPDIAELSAEDIQKQVDAAKVYLKDVGAGDGDLDLEALDHVDEVLAFVDTAKARIGEIEAEDAANTERLEAARARIASLDEEPAAEVDEPAAEVVDEPAAEVVDEPVEEPVLASGSRRATVAKAARKAPAVILPKEPEPKRRNVVTAAADVPEFNSGQELSGMDEVVKAFLSRAGTFAGAEDHRSMKPGTYALSKNAVRKGVARIRRDESEFSVDRDQSLEAQMTAIMAATDEVARFGKFGGLAEQALTAAGGWCAPSETIYELFGYETSAGLFDIPEVTARRGGISFTKGPDFMTIFGDADAGFMLTETQVEAGATKPCYALECPPFEEVRLDAVGFCATAPLLTEAAYPELVRRVLNLLGLGHQRRKSASTIQRISTLIGAGVTFAPVNAAGSQSGIADSLAALELRANQIRQSLAMDPNATIEGVAPWWARGAWRTDLSRRLGLSDPFNITDADIDRYIAARNIRLQYVYDYQMLGVGALGTAGGTATWTAWPTTLEFMLWPAGAFVRLVNDVISLDAVYDHDLLTQNEYTAAFVEEGMAVANTRGFGLKTTVALNPEGSAGFPAIGAGSGITFAAA
jgi:hypothetical protein